MRPAGTSCATRAAVIGLRQSAGPTLIAHGIDVNAIAASGRMGPAAGRAGMAIFPATDEAAQVVAQCFGVDGGNGMA